MDEDEYHIRFTGVYDEESSVNKLMKITGSTSRDSLVSSINKKSYVKKNIDLNSAIKFKNKFESIGVPLDIQRVVNSRAAEEKESDDERLGKLIIILSIFTLPVWLLFSDGYHPDLGFMYSLLENMKIYDGCWASITVKDSINSWITHEVCDFNVVLYTRYMFVFSFIVLAYGYLMYKGIIKSPAFIREIVSKWDT